MVHQPSIRDLKAIVESYNQEVEEASRMPNGDPVPDSLEVDIKDTEVWKNRNKPRNDFEPKTNMCPDCEGTGDRLTGSDHAFPGLGYECERCNGEGAVFEDRDDDDTDGPLVPDNVYATIVADLAKAKPGYQPGAMGKTSDQPNQVSVMAWNPKTDHEEDMIFNTDTMSFEGSDDDFMLANPFESINEAASRKDFRLVANLISKIEDPVVRDSSAEDHATMFALQNPRFDKDKFMAACGVNEIEETADFPAQGSEQECAWWAGCSNDATTTEPHPVLGNVPICDRCVGKLRKIEGLDEETLTELDRDTYLSYLKKATDDAQNHAKSGLAAEMDDDPDRANAEFGRVKKRFKGAERASDALITRHGDDPELAPHMGELELTRTVARQQGEDLDDILGEGDKPYATMKDGPDKYLFRKDQKQKLVGSADNEPEDGEEELEETDMDKFIKEMQVAAGIISEVIEDDYCDKCDKELEKCECDEPEYSSADSYLKMSEDCDSPDIEPDKGVCSPFTHADDNVDMVREDGTWPGVYEETEKWEGQSVKITGGKYAGETGKVIHAEAPHGESGSRQAEFMVNLHSGGVVTLYPGEWADDQLELQYDPNVRPEGKYDPALEEDDLAKALGTPQVSPPDLSDIEYEICPECGVTGGHDDACGELAKLYQEDAMGEDLLLAPPGDVGPGVDEDDFRTEPELDRQTDFDAPPRDDGDDSYDDGFGSADTNFSGGDGYGDADTDNFGYESVEEEPNDDDRIIDVGDDEDYETYDFDDEFEQMLGGSSDMPGAEYNGMYEMNDLRRLAGLEKVMEEEECDEEETCDEDKEELDEIAPVIAAVARGAGAALADKAVDSLTSEDAGGSDVVAYDIADEKAYYVMQDVLGAELDFGPEDEILVPLTRNDQVLAALGQQGLEKDVAFRVAGEQLEGDLQNGYNDRAFSDGQDYFPKGATSQPAVDLGPTAGDQGDNPMANKMRSVEKDDVYEGMKLAYRRHRKA